MRLYSRPKHTAQCNKEVNGNEEDSKKHMQLPNRTLLKNMEEINNSEGKTAYNYGWCLLRMFMCFEVVLVHFWTRNNTPFFLTPFALFGGIAVPVFIFLSFYLTENIYLEQKYIKTIKRLWRIVFPLIGWAIIYWVAYTLEQFVFNLDIELRFTDMIWQIMTGHSPKLNASMWFQSVLIFLSILYIAIFKYFSTQKGILITYFLLVLALIIQYSGINVCLFDNLRYELKYPLGRICEMIPYATIGFSFAYFNLLEKLKRYRFSAIIIALPLILIVLIIKLKIQRAPGFGYSGIENILFAVTLVVFAYLVPIEMLPEKIKNIFLQISKYTLGIYCIHRLVATFILAVEDKVGITIDSFLLCVITYAVGYIISFAISKIPFKLPRQLVD